MGSLVTILFFVVLLSVLESPSDDFAALVVALLALVALAAFVALEGVLEYPYYFESLAMKTYFNK